MRKLYLVPIIHTSSDMGSLALAISERGAAALGKEVWRRHQETVSGFWDSIAQFFNSLEVDGFKIYQDGLVADGKDGLQIVDEGMRRGSANYALISSLLQSGAVLITTEDISLVKREHGYITELIRAKSLLERETAALRYKLAQRKLLEERDDFIAKKIDMTLQEGDTGVLFIGAYHDVSSRLPADILVVEIKEATRVKEYHTLLTAISARKQSQRLQQLAEYLVSPIPDVLS
ncbi:MAG: hypothetical protein HY665_08065 [Chloroflexi bacterium]|nr:hypothetical protein [Chloroflexota bacterium]